MAGAPAAAAETARDAFAAAAQAASAATPQKTAPLPVMPPPAAPVGAAAGPTSLAAPYSGVGAPSPARQGVGPLVWASVAGAFVVGLAAGSLGTCAVVEPNKSLAPVATASASVPPTTDSATALPPPPEPTFLEKVTTGDGEAIKKLEAKSVEQRSAEEAVALARGRTAMKRMEITKLGEAVADDPALAQDRQMLRRLRKHAKDAEIADRVLAIVAGMPGSGGGDVLYDVWFRTRKTSPVAQLAEELLFSKDVRAKASPALSVLLDLRIEKDCERVQAIVARAAEHGDMRCLIPLGRLVPKVGCGKRKVEDCYPCLGNRAGVRDAITAVRRRPMPML